MIAPAVLFLVSLLALFATLGLDGYFDFIVISGPCTLASLFLLLRALRRRATAKTSSSYVVIDGSNAMHWKDETPQIDTLRDIIAHLSGLGLTPGVVFDANAGYLLTGKYRHNRAMEKLLNLPKDRVIVVPKGTPADPMILEAARHLDARIVTNDRFRDWAGDFPEITEPGHLIKGGYRSGKLWLDLKAVGT